MAFSVNHAFPLVMFLHVKDADDIKTHHLQGQSTVVLVDSVVNTGNTIVDFVQHVRKLHFTVRIVVVARVVQAQCVSEGGLNQALARHGNSILLHFAFPTRNSLAVAPRTLATVYSIQRIYPEPDKHVVA